ncbi:MAG: GNAT family N-acetyltransferase [Eubacteriales bacterium]|nr:GNAT family N-acetyltransferase [Eubacteriales bacterium]
MNNYINNIEFEPLSEKIFNKLNNIFSKCQFQITEYSLGTLIIYDNILHSKFHIDNNYLIIKFNYNNEIIFQYPIVTINENNDEIEFLALLKIEEYCMLNNLSLNIVNIPEAKIDKIIKRYPNININCIRKNKDYIYNAKELIDFPGRVYSKKKNLINQFNKNYINSNFRRLTIDDINIINDFFIEYEKSIIKEKTKEVLEELLFSKIIFQYLKYDFFYAGGLFIDNKLVGINISEISGNTLITHIEKALYQYKGIYTKLMNECYKNFPKIFDYINRENDMNDKGLRKAKYQYKPLYLLNKYWIKCDNIYFNKITKLPSIQTERLLINEILEEDIKLYNELIYDLDRNKLWGNDDIADAKNILKIDNLNDNSFFNVQEYYFNNKIQISLAIRLNKILIGEVLLYNYDFRGNIEIGIRINKKYNNLGYGIEAFNAICDYALYDLGFNKVKAKCLKENIQSKKMILKRMHCINEDEKYIFFESDI